jgi:hypothetical protein
MESLKRSLDRPITYRRRANQSTCPPQFEARTQKA